MDKYRSVCILATILCFTFYCFQLQAQYQYPFQNPELSSEERIDNALSLMTIEEKVECLSTNPKVERLGIKGSWHVEGLHGLALGGPAKWGGDTAVYTTIFPQAIGLAETWNPEVMNKVATIESTEARYIFQNAKYDKGGLVIRAPNADLGRDPRWGRTEECYGEDAFLTSKMAVAFIEGLQGKDSKYWRTASLMKHFLANSNENGRDSSNSLFDERLFYEYYSLPFYKGITNGGSRAFMAAYNGYNGIPMAVHPVIKQVTINDWGQNGIVCTDGGAFKMLVNAHHYYQNESEAAAGALHAGINQFLDDYKTAVNKAIEDGYITEEELDAALRGAFRVMIKLGLWDPQSMVPYSKIGDSDTPPWEEVAQKKAAREVTEQSIVLLKNENSKLPLNPDKVKKIAVIGSAANSVFLDWYSGTPAYSISPYEGIKTLLGDKVEVRTIDDSSNEQAMLDLAQWAEEVILVVGNHPYCNDRSWKKCETESFGKEAVDRRSIILEEEELVKKIYTVNHNTVMVLMSSFPYAINWSNENLPAILHMTHNSQETGSALANVLFGNYNPAGRLVQTWPKEISQLPDMMDYNIRNGRTYMYFKSEPLYAFGYGLSYTSFRYSALKMPTVWQADDVVNIKFKIKNTGSIDGDEVAQVYVKYLSSEVERPIMELKGFQRVNIIAGNNEEVTIKVKVDELAYWSVKEQKFTVEPGKVEVMVGSSSDDIKLTKVITIK